MCGIIGGCLKTSVPVHDINESLDSMSHRGPDDSGVYQDGNVFLGNRRLSIIDLSGGHQPVFSEDKSVVVVFNGEIYNYIELISFLESKGHVFKTRSDTECLVHLWEDYGTDMCQFLRGMFAFAIWDSNKRELFVARDRFGQKPLYYTIPKTGGVIFASEIKALKSLAVSLDEIWNISDQAIYHYLSLAAIPQPMTIYSEVKTLLPSHWIAYSNQKLTFGKYWELNYRPDNNLSYSDAMENTRALIAESVKLRLRSDVPVGIFLSSGIDSSIVAFEAAKIIGDSLNTFTISVPDTNFNEAPVAQRTAAFLGVKNTYLPVELDLEKDVYRIVEIYDQPYADSSAILTLRVAELARAHLKVVLTGDGGDEMFAGYRRHISAHYLGYLKHWPGIGLIGEVAKFFNVPRRSKFGLILRLLRCAGAKNAVRYLNLTTDMLLEKDKTKLWRRVQQSSTESFLTEMNSHSLSGLRSQMDLDTWLNLVSDLLVKMDMATMAGSLEARSPLLDHKLAEFASTLPDKYLVHSTRTKPFLRDAYEGKLPDEVIKAPKRGFELPMASILKDQLKPMVMDTLGATNSKVSEYLNHEFVTDLLAEKVMLDRNWGYIVYSLLILELWLRAFD
ncbi:MAG: asparagine synthase (glutamine-hydrolyzing) [Deltaproteobacteria bacterium]|nr:asparagine synthase (glutamine-hydrolyzing) [Deltaproteobacteria bacterium]